MNQAKLAEFFLGHIHMGVHLLHPSNYKFTSGITVQNEAVTSFQRVLKQQINLANRIYEHTNSWIDCTGEIIKYVSSYDDLRALYQNVLASGIYVEGYALGLPTLPADLNLTRDEKLFFDFDQIGTEFQALLFTETEATQKKAARVESFALLDTPQDTATETVSPSFAGGAKFTASFNSSRTSHEDDAIKNGDQIMLSDRSSIQEEADVPKRKSKRKAKKLDIASDESEETEHERKKARNRESAQKSREKKVELRNSLEKEFAQLCAENQTLQSLYIALERKLNAMKREQGLPEKPLRLPSPPHTPTFFAASASDTLSRSVRISHSTAQRNDDVLSDEESEQKRIRRQKNRKSAQRSRDRKSYEINKLTCKTDAARDKNRELRTIISRLNIELTETTAPQEEDYEWEVGEEICSGPRVGL